MTDIDAIIIGAGAIGLAAARELAMRGLSVIILEREKEFGSATSSRNSEVIHAGLYYPVGSLKARLCVEGKTRLYAFCQSHGVSHRRCGKLIVAENDEETTLLAALREKGVANGCDDLELIDEQQARLLEPALACRAALLSPSTGIIDSHGYMLALLGEAEDHGAALALNTPFERAEAAGTGFRVHTGGRDPMSLTCRLLINSAGLVAPMVARNIEGLPAHAIPQARFAKGSYFSLAGKSPFSRLIYPAPHTHGLGVHLTLDLAGQARFGPDIEWVEAIDYAVDPRRMDGFGDAIRRYWPGLPEDALVPAYSGIRPKISGPDEPAMDFRIDGREEHELSGLVNLFGIESPGLTASLAIASEVAVRLEA
ncbi:MULTISPECIES: NAD(P)/FAD-dependent oxidoreductase [unclassified Agrobacterium]|uniref:NAD(P)/FAD-dependent oxidoreductase n=1 Tax=unclassified Agrobacterium TaxID=2632611 RepID=UPI00244B22D8|nr:MULTISPECIES: NAD(P)/FAD-dependent oxidoreductase [unclassified Agrobacterium]MDH0614732.1 NAD(P)/FAD-dependent oxidoreductase [Agrobacterium sp. GD03872]MDH0697025.1 NAD(P)/FAD-dependent oxidoreductase [Agrobacterium sp. GD03871]MDH1059505.1 NAD(P)/FAD-dependent oxidoreductase [Agrobacterium sp. GD03992]MDH2212212.1 NAD(P)/FAD-dependent oxidoreductase [Agrobacterium sp. GD03643]MDH2220012.1 NAD(P)/FAD-dependent oxidoreductase [Agrobacterium sp. GD03638]